MNISEFQKKTGLSFHDGSLLETALTHSSFGRENDGHSNNERLEFLGDAFLDAIIGAELYGRLKDSQEGKLTKTRALIVCERTLAEIARSIDLGSYMNMGRGEELGGGRNKDSILADCMEAVIGAIFLDGGYEKASDFVARYFGETIRRAISGELFSDYKSELQEKLQAGGKPVAITYITDREEGPAHRRVFFVHMEVDGRICGRGSGKSKKEAEQNAARDAISRISEIEEETNVL